MHKTITIFIKDQQNYPCYTISPYLTTPDVKLINKGILRKRYIARMVDGR